MSDQTSLILCLDDFKKYEVTPGYVSNAININLWKVFYTTFKLDL